MGAILRRDAKEFGSFDWDDGWMCRRFWWKHAGIFFFNPIFIHQAKISRREGWPRPRRWCTRVFGLFLSVSCACCCGCCLFDRLATVLSCTLRSAESEVVSTALDKCRISFSVTGCFFFCSSFKCFFLYGQQSVGVF